METPCPPSGVNRTRDRTQTWSLYDTDTSVYYTVRIYEKRSAYRAGAGVGFFTGFFPDWFDTHRSDKLDQLEYTGKIVMWQETGWDCAEPYTKDFNNFDEDTVIGQLLSGQLWEDR